MKKLIRHGRTAIFSATLKKFTVFFYENCLLHFDIQTGKTTSYFRLKRILTRDTNSSVLSSPLTRQILLSPIYRAGLNVSPVERRLPGNFNSFEEKNCRRLPTYRNYILNLFYVCAYSIFISYFYSIFKQPKRVSGSALTGHKRHERFENFSDIPDIQLLVQAGNPTDTLSRSSS